MEYTRAVISYKKAEKILPGGPSHPMLHSGKVVRTHKDKRESTAPQPDGIGLEAQLDGLSAEIHPSLTAYQEVP